MQRILNLAIMEELEAELQQQFSLQEPPDSWRRAAKRFSFDFSDSPNSQYVLTVSVSACGWVKATLRRRPDIYLHSQRLRLADPKLFEQLANSIRSWMKHDLQLLRDLDRAIEKLKPALHQAAMQLQGWRVGLPTSRMDSHNAEVCIHLQPRALRLTFPNVDYCLTLTVDNLAGFQVSVNAVPPTAKIAKNVFSFLQRANAQASSFWQIDDLPAVLSHQQHQIEKYVLAQFLPIESDVPTPYVRQSLLVVVPLRLANAARELDEVAWHRELVDVCLSRLAAQTADAQNVLRRLFFQLLQLELAEPEHRSRLDAEYQRFGLMLANLRKSDQTLPYNPVVFYQRYCRGVAAPGGKLSKEDRITYQWFLETATLEQVVDLMSLV